MCKQVPQPPGDVWRCVQSRPPRPGEEMGAQGRCGTPLRHKRVPTAKDYLVLSVSGAEGETPCLTEIRSFLSSDPEFQRLENVVDAIVQRPALRAASLP